MGSRLGSRHGPRGRPRRSHLCPTLRFIRGLSRLRRRAWRLYTLGHWRRSGWSTWGRRLPLGLYRAAILDRRRRLRTAHLTAPLLIAPLRPARPLGSGRDLGSALLAARRRRRLRTAEVRLRRLHLRLRAAILDRRRRLRTAHLTATLLIAPLRPARPLGSGRDLGSALLAARRRRRLRTAEVRLRRLHLRLRAAILDRRRRLRTAHLTATLLIAPLRPARPLGSGRDLGSALLAARRRRRLRTAEVRLRRLHLRLRAAILDRRRRLRTAHLTAPLLIAPLRPARPLGSGRDLGSALLAARRRRRLRTAEVRLRRLHLRLRAAILDRRRRLRTAHLTAPLLIAPLRPARPLGSGRDLGSALLAARRRRRLRTAEVRLRRLHLRLRAAILDRRRRLRTAHLTATLLIA